MTYRNSPVSPNVASITTGEVMRGERPILFVSHDRDDGTWQFLTGDAFDFDDAMMVSLHSVLELDPSLAAVADLPRGWLASRSSLDSDWVRLEEVEEP